MVGKRKGQRRGYPVNLFFLMVSWGLTNFSDHFIKALTSKKTLPNFNMHAHTKKPSRHSPRAKIKCSLVITINRKGDGLPESEYRVGEKPPATKTS